MEGPRTEKGCSGCIYVITVLCISVERSGILIPEALCFSIRFFFC